MGNIKRREFLKGSSAAAASTLLFSNLSANSLISGPVANKSKSISGSHFGAFRAHVKGGQFTGVTAFEDDPNPSPMINALPSRTYAKTRVEYPMVREGFLKHGHKSDTSKRGSDKFVRVSWEKALDLVASEVQRVQKSYGYKSIYAGSYGWYCTGKLHNPQTLMNRMMKISGGFVGRIGDYSAAAAQIIMPHVVGSIEVYEQQTSWPLVLKHAKNVVFWGANPLVTCQIDWDVSGHGAFPYLEQLKKAHKKGQIDVISVDPVKNDTAMYFDSKMIQPKPNTDVAMMLGMMYYLHTSNQYDKEFIKKYTVGFKDFEEYLLGKVDNTPKTLTWASNICGVKEKDIKDFAQKLKDEKSMLMAGWAVQRADHGEQFHWTLVTLACMLGQVGTPGCGFGFSYHYSNGGTPSSYAPGLGGISTNINSSKNGPWTKYEPFNIPCARMVDMISNPGKVIDFNGKKIEYPEIKMVYWTSGNPFHHHQDRNTMIEAWKKLETFIVHEPFWTPTARMADIVLPATTEIERNDIEIIGDYNSSHIIAMKKAIDPVKESKDDYEICRLISKRLGYEEEFTDGKKSQMDWIKEFYNNSKVQGENKGIKMPTFEEFWEKGYVKFEVREEDKNFTRYEEYVKNPMLNPLGTPSGKIEISSRVIKKFNYDDCLHYPSWIEPAEWLGSEESEEYPLHVLSPHPKYRLHSQLSNTWIRDLYEVNGREPIWLNPIDAKKRGIKNGDIVKVYNKRGSTLAGAIVTKNVLPGVVKMDEGGWYDPKDPGKDKTMCKHGDVNQLTIDKGTSKLAQGNISNTALVQIEKYTKKAPRITVFEKPEIV
ncbi:trimethylamine-N-oxide reductase TorA [Malaciobacter canalis]|uniref:trimethylamine-N-oxide reductase TorA n=1 Tax=Malaciobacter canalis TaxID=1912871 RepID=UPI00384F6336